MKHTLGPWIAAKDNNGRPYVLADGTIRIADCWYLPIGKEHGGEAEANAKLIAAAPELLEVVRDYLESGFDVADTPLRQRARAAFSKATE